MRKLIGHSGTSSMSAIRFGKNVMTVFLNLGLMMKYYKTGGSVTYSVA